MSSTLAPVSVSELVDAVRSTPRLLPVGGGTKPRLTRIDGKVDQISIRGLTGIQEYDPSEFTFTALAGTPLQEIAAALAQRGQYLPFDPMFVRSGGTLGGAVAAGLSGPGRLRFGGIRDFILGVRFVDGIGRLLRLGGKVVKNAAGFDLPKFFVGSLGRFGVLAELTFKAFPQPAARLTLQLEAESMEYAARLLNEVAGGRWEAEALDVSGAAQSIYLRLAGPLTALELMAREILGRWPGKILPTDAADRIWSDIVEFQWTHPEGVLVKIPMTPERATVLESEVAQLKDSRLHLSGGGCQAFVSLLSNEQASALSQRLERLGFAGLMLRGEGPLWLGPKSRPAIASAVKRALDPDDRFPSLDE